MWNCAFHDTRNKLSGDDLHTIENRFLRGTIFLVKGRPKLFKIKTFSVPDLRNDFEAVDHSIPLKKLEVGVFL